MSPATKEFGAVIMAGAGVLVFIVQATSVLMNFWKTLLPPDVRLIALPPRVADIWKVSFV